MSRADGGPLAWPSPLVDTAVSFDAYKAVAVDGDHLAVTLTSGAAVQARCSVPHEGVLRIRVGPSVPEPAPPSPLLVDLTADPASYEADGGSVRIHGPGVEAHWDTDGLRCGRYREASPASLVGRGLASAGRLVGVDGSHAGWLVTAALTPATAVYGGGESFQGPDLRGRVRRLCNVENHGSAGVDFSYLNVPFIWSDDGWGIFCHTSAPSRIDAGATHTEVLAWGVEDPVLDLFLIAGPDPLDILRRYHALTGRPGSFPDWGLGVWTSRCSYLSEAELHEILDGYEQARCPVDVVHVDAWVEGNVVADLACNWNVDRERFPSGWADRLYDRGVRTSLWHNPYVLEGSVRAKELEDAGWLVTTTDGQLARTPDKPDRFVLDFTDPGAVAWWKQRVHETVATEKVHAFKPDFAEELPNDGLLADGRTGRQARNEYAERYQAATHEALAAALGTDAVALFCRSGTAGSQRHPCHWVGDTPSTWEGLATALRACLSLSLSGFGLVSHDIGGFWTGGSHGWVAEAFAVMDNRDIPADVEPELFTRWAQFGALSPVMRFHGTGRREPWAYPDPWGPIAVEACRLRDRLRPYLVDVAAEAAEAGTPAMRPLALSHPEASLGRGAELQYLLGPDLLVAPLVEPGGRRRLWAPPGRWEPIIGLDPIEGPGWVDVECRPEQFPAWSRAGSALGR